MTKTPFANLITHSAPGEFRAALVDADQRPSALFVQRWSGAGERARYGDISQARIRSFAHELSGAFVELRSGEEAFLRLKSRDGLSEGAILSVQIRSERRADKLARVSVSDKPIEAQSAFQRWLSVFPGASGLEATEDASAIEAAFSDVLEPSSVLPGGGRLSLDQTRALIAVDIDTAGRTGSGSAGARALQINRAAVLEMARQISIRGFGGLLVLDCVNPLNNAASDRVRQAARAAFELYAVPQAKVLKPSALGLLEASIPWRFTPIVEQIQDDPAETELLGLLRDLHRAARSDPMALYTLTLGGAVWSAYQARKSDLAASLGSHLGGRVQISKSSDGKSEFRPR